MKENIMQRKKRIDDELSVKIKDTTLRKTPKPNTTSVTKKKTPVNKNTTQQSQTSNITSGGGGSLYYKHKYLKYKTKYINLRNF